jgi:putative pre-16S rRNA nuclease
MTTSSEDSTREEPGDFKKSPGSGSDAAPAIPTEGRLLGLDYGHVRVGVAVSTPEQNIASPLENYTRGSDAADADFLRRIVDEYRIAGLVVGLPVHMSGDESESSRLAREFGAWVGRVTGLPVAFWDERFTSSLAEAHLLSARLSKKKRAARRDKLAATFLLQSYLDADDRGRERPTSYGLRDRG